MHNLGIKQKFAHVLQSCQKNSGKKAIFLPILSSSSGSGCTLMFRTPPIVQIILHGCMVLYRCRMRNCVVTFTYFTEPPHIVSPPTTATISLTKTRQVRFNCTARGILAPVITWRHNGVETTSFRYHVTQSMSVQEPWGYHFISTGTLSIYLLNEEDSGWVECIVKLHGKEMTGEEFQDVERTRLSVLGESLIIKLDQGH